MEFLRDLLLERKRGHFRGLDVGESEEVWTSYLLRFPLKGIGEADIDDDLVEESAGELGSRSVSECCPLLPLFAFVDLLDGEHEMVIELCGLRGDHVHDGRLFVVSSDEVDVFGGAARRLKAEVESERSLQDPPIGG